MRSPARDARPQAAPSFRNAARPDREIKRASTAVGITRLTRIGTGPRTAPIGSTINSSNAVMLRASRAMTQRRASLAGAQPRAAPRASDPRSDSSDPMEGMFGQRYRGDAAVRRRFAVGRAPNTYSWAPRAWGGSPTSRGHRKRRASPRLRPGEISRSFEQPTPVDDRPALHLYAKRRPTEQAPDQRSNRLRRAGL